MSLDDVVELITAFDPAPAVVVFRIRVTLLLLQHTKARPGQLTGVQQIMDSAHMAEEALHRSLAGMSQRANTAAQD